MARPKKNVKIVIKRQYVGERKIDEVFSEILTQALAKVPLPEKKPPPCQDDIPA
jgi:hypothetical protein